MRGRSYSAVRTGLWIKSRLMVLGDASIAAMHREYKAYIKNQNLARSAKKQIRPPTYDSFLKYVHNLTKLGLVEPSGREEPLPNKRNTLLQIKAEEVVHSRMRFYRVTALGIKDTDSWTNTKLGIRKDRLNRLGHNMRCRMPRYLQLFIFICFLSLIRNHCSNPQFTKGKPPTLFGNERLNTILYQLQAMSAIT